YQHDSEGDDVEVDELVSDTEDEQLASASTAGQKKGGRKLGERAPGTTLLPAARIENMIHADGVTGNLSMSKEAVFMLSVATEEFVKRMVQAGHRSATAFAQAFSPQRRQRNNIQEFMFLHDTIPEPISLSEALERREIKLKEDLAANPAVSSFFIVSPYPSLVSTPTERRKRRVAHPRKRTNLHVAVQVHTTEITAKIWKWRWMISSEVNHVLPPSRSSSGRVIKASRAVREGMQESMSGDAVNGSAHQPDPVEPWSGSASPPRTTSAQRPAYDYQQPFPPSWPGQYTGPASGFLQDPSHAWTYVKQNPGRTIYSQQSRPENATYR
ncbi:hypothetical protein F5141DRAFT_1002373, partial [Pisolithus sp. B1]